MLVYQNIPYPDRFSSLNLAKISFSAKATIKYHCTTELFPGPQEASTKRFRLCVCSLEKRSLGFFSFVFDSFFVQLECRILTIFVIPENYLLLVAFVEFGIDERESFGDSNRTGLLDLNEISSYCGTFGTNLLQYTQIKIMEL